MNRKKIWILNHYANPPYVGGGTRHYDLAEELVKHGHDVKIFASGFNHQLRISELKPGEIIRKEIINGVNFIRLKTFPYQKNDLRRVINIISFALFLFFAGLREMKPDIIIASSPHPLTCLVGWLLAKIKKSRYIAEMRDLWPQTFIDMGAIKEMGLPAKILRQIEKFIYRKAEKMIVLLPGAINYFKSKNMDDSKVLYIPNGVNIKNFDQTIKVIKESPDVAQIIEQHKEKFKVLYLGAHGQANALHHILDAAKIIQELGYSDINILLVGDGPEKNVLMKKAIKEGLHNTFFYRPVRKTEVPLLIGSVQLCLFHLADVDVFKYGISPNKLFDYLCARKPIVFACNTSGDPISASGSGITVPPEDPRAIARAIVEIYHLPDHIRKQMGENGRIYVEQHHDIPVLAAKLESIL